MLSSENPPSDPSEIIGDCSNGRASDDNQLRIDSNLPEAGLDCGDPLLKFSIRDYVFSTRDNDLENHWPFSKKSLQLCLKHSVDNVLPPYQSLSSVRNQISDDLNIKSSVSERVEASATINQSCSERNSVLVATSCSLEPEAVYLPEKPELAAKKSENNIPKPVKKSRLRVKLSGTADPKAKEEFPGNSLLGFEAMASKVCPVCKTFSSSSNTTLNAHIDQCLSVEQGMRNSKVVKHKIRPRKVRLMVDVYATAQKCTLEDLEKRNGKIWAAFSELQELERDKEENNRVLSPVNAEENTDDCIRTITDKFSFIPVDKNEKAVYFDSSGIKVRILSRLTDVQEKPSLEDSNELQKLVKKDKWRRSFPSEKNLDHNRNHKLLRSYSSIPSYSLKAQKTTGAESSHEEDEEEDAPPHSRACDQFKLGCPGITKHRLHKSFMNRNQFKLGCPGITKHRLHKSFMNRNQCEWKITRIRSALLGCSSKMKASDSRTVSAADAPLLPESSRENRSFSGSHEEYVELPRLRKRTKFCAYENPVFHGEKMRMLLLKLNEDKDMLLAHKRCRNLRDGSENQASAERSLLSLEKRSGDCAFSSGDGNLSSKASVSHSKKKGVDAKRPRLYYSTSSEEEADTSQESETHGIQKDLQDFSRNDTPVGTSCYLDDAKNAELQSMAVSEPTSKALGTEASLILHESTDSRFRVPKHGQLSMPRPHFEEEMNAFEERGKYFADVDPIPIPGPSGSFLPSPGRVASEEPQGNSSLTTCRVIHYSENDEHEVANAESPDSPISTTSFVNPPLNISMSSSGVSYYESHHGPSGACPLTVRSSTGLELGAGVGFSTFKNCQPYLQMERNEQSMALNYLGPFSGTEAVSCVPLSFQKELRERNDIALRSIEPTKDGENPLHVIATGTTVSCNSDAKFSNPSAVLRLMGKNLTVGESLPPVTRPDQSNLIHCPPFLHSSTENALLSTSLSSMAVDAQNCLLRRDLGSYPSDHFGAGAVSGFQHSSAGVAPNGSYKPVMTTNEYPMSYSYGTHRLGNQVNRYGHHLLTADSSGALYGERQPFDQFSASTASGYGYGHVNQHPIFTAQPTKQGIRDAFRWTNNA